ncbi:RxLR effector protein [Phytophthora megakarya]|uniref:RxLR effector protein n=1 Tax=Phytophthora megakarya TaxID=4795 RepID=A0A225VVL5_9STRA|nr:RxLR effector protein [Phytophthora megakarya]
MVTTLTKTYGDEGVAKRLRNAKGISRFYAGVLEEGLFTKWLSDKKSVGSVFSLLKLGETGENLFKSSLLSFWVQYAHRFHKNPDRAMFLTLNSHFGDESLAKMLVARRAEIKLAVRLEKEEVEHWLNSGKTSDDGNLMENPAFKTWVLFVTRAETESSYDVVFSKIAAHYCEERLAKLILTTRRDSESNLITENLEVVLQNNWVNGGRSAEDVFKLL